MATPSTATPSPLPRILCLHGGGTSALIFKIQMRNITRALHTHFRFIFLDAPFPSTAGPGVLPVFADCAPYYRWMPVEDYQTRGLEAGIREQEDAARESRQRIVEAIRKDDMDGTSDDDDDDDLDLAHHSSATNGMNGRPRPTKKGPVVAVMGFSQGGRMTAGLLADQHAHSSFPGIPAFAFGVSLCGSYPPYSLANASKSPLAWSGPKDEYGVLKGPPAEEVIAIPSVHVRGLVDPNLERGRRLMKYFAKAGGEAGGDGDGEGNGAGGGAVLGGEKGFTEELEFEMAHHLPQAAGDTTSGGQAATNEIRDAILRVWERSQAGGGGEAPDDE